MNISDKLRLLREHFNLTKSDMSRLLSISPKGYSVFEDSGTMPIDRLIFLCTHFKISPYYFILEDFDIMKKDYDKLTKEETRVINDYRQINDHDRLEIKTLLNLKVSRIENFEKNEKR